MKQQMEMAQHVELKRTISNQPKIDIGVVSLYVNGRRCLVNIDFNSFIYEPELSISKDNERTTIPLDRIVSIWTCRCHRGDERKCYAKNKPCYCPCLSVNSDFPFNSEPIDPSAKNQPSFIIKLFYAQSTEKDGYRLEMLSLAAHDSVNNMAGLDARRASEHILLDIAFKIKDTIDAFNRPKRLLMFVNPFGGARQATKIFETKVKPILQLACVDYDVTVTKRANQARETLLEMEDLSIYDGIPPIKLGIIPAGSTDAIVFATNGNKDPVNSLLSILLNRTINIDVAAVHHRGEDRLIRYTASFLGYGFFGDTLIDSERNRWLGPKRYDWAGIKKFFSHRLYSGEIKMCIEQKDGSPKQYNPCGPNCCNCIRAGKKSRQVLSEEESPACISIRGRFLAINAATVSGRCGKSKYGMSPMAHIGNGCTDLILVYKCSRWNYLRYLLSVALSNRSPFDFNFVDTYRVREFEFNPIIEPHKRNGYTFEKEIDYDFFDAVDEAADEMNQNGTELSKKKSRSNKGKIGSRSKRNANANYSLGSSVWNCDGEVTKEAAIHVKVHCQLIQMFATGFDVDRLLFGRATKILVIHVTGIDKNLYFMISFGVWLESANFGTTFWTFNLIIIGASSIPIISSHPPQYGQWIQCRMLITLVRIDHHQLVFGKQCTTASSATI
ncbi:hypothetical protein BLOT_011121 [Blomia tropicalis]|nr:hypothetical protein BLOT_011121 [Blomia tropicalis]